MNECVCECMYVCVYVCVYVYVCLIILCIFVCLSVCLSVCLHACMQKGMNVLLHTYFFQGVCIFVAALLHYLYLVTMSWMLVEGVILYFKIVEVFNIVTKMARFYIFAWGKEQFKKINIVLCACVFDRRDPNV